MLQLLDEHTHGPAVGNQMMKSKQRDVLVPGFFQQTNAKQRLARRHGERRFRIPVQPFALALLLCVDGAVAHIEQSNADRHLGCNNLRLPVSAHISAQRFVPPDDGIDRFAPRIDAQRPAQPKQRGLVQRLRLAPAGHRSEP
ncbi:hypothetical protein Elgi_47390 [Paenibacillus elgii]|nr:hypothetical protein Elgi_47390 [Paenibacillus elgii]